jgi:hypothetical protein
MAVTVPAATFVFRSLDLLHLAHMWSALGATVFFVWFAWQFRSETVFLRRFAGPLISVILICGALFCVDKLIAPFAPVAMERSTEAWAVVSARVALFLAGYGLYLRLAHWDFLLSLRKK